MVILNILPVTPVAQLKPPNFNLVSPSKLHDANSRNCSRLYVENTNKYKNRRRISIIDSVTSRLSRDTSVVKEEEEEEEENNIGGVGREGINAEWTQFNLNRLEATLNDLSKWLMVALFSLVLVSRHDAKAIWIAMGSVLNVGLSITLKKILNQERPSSAAKSDPGMPSSHAQSIFFISLVVILSMMDWLGMNTYTASLAGLVLAFGSYFTWLRVSQGFHTMSQVAVGAAAGSLYAGIWFWLWDAIVYDAFMSSMWVRVVVVVGGLGCILRFGLFIIQDWMLKEH